MSGKAPHLSLKCVFLSTCPFCLWNYTPRNTVFSLQLLKSKDLHLSRTVCSVFFWSTDIGDICDPGNFSFLGIVFRVYSFTFCTHTESSRFCYDLTSTTGSSAVSTISVLCSSPFIFSVAPLHGISARRTNPELS